MSTSNLGLNTSTVRTALPYFSAALGFLALGGGLYNFIDPREAAKAFGLTLSPSASEKSNEVRPVEEAFCRVHGIRNISTGLTTLTMSYLIAFSDMSRKSPVAAETLRKVLGLSFMIGSLVGFTDGWLLKQFSQSSGIEAEATELATTQSKGHATFAVPILGLGLAYWFV